VRDLAAAVSGVAVRPASAADAARISNVHVESWQTAYRGLVPQSILDGLSIERRSDFWSRRLLEPAETKTWLGEQDGEIVGFVATAHPSDPELPPDTAEVESIYLLAPSRGLGLGRLLLKTATHDLVERGFASAILWVFHGKTTERGASMRPPAGTWMGQRKCSTSTAPRSRRSGTVSTW
jgi:ribosomal protein S18 acetylase RimI-like enzyme